MTTWPPANSPCRPAGPKPASGINASTPAVRPACSTKVWRRCRRLRPGVAFWRARGRDVKRLIAGLALGSVLLGWAGEQAAAQQPGLTTEVVVTGMRRNTDDFDPSVPVIGLRKVADFAVQEITISGDTRDAAKRHDEIF